MIAQLVTYSGTNGVVLSPSEIVVPIVAGVLAAIGAAVALFVIAILIRYVMRAARESASEGWGPGADGEGWEQRSKERDEYLDLNP